MAKCKQLFMLILLVTASQMLVAQQLSPNKIIASYDSLRTIAPREKLYIHFDKSTYAQGDTVWFKAYLVNSIDNDYSKLSGLIYTEMIAPNGDVVATRCLPTGLGLTWGSFALADDRYPPGNYTFRAYTNWMKNFGDTYIFSQAIKILSLETQTAPASGAKIRPANSRKPSGNAKTTPIIDLQFLPEGGSWIADAPQRMAFKAITGSGKGLAIIGEVFDSKQNKVLEFKSNKMGMGYFTMVPSAGEMYTAKITSAQGTINKDLPKIVLTGTTLAVNPQYSADSLQILFTASLPQEELVIIGQSKGIVCFVARANTAIKRKSIILAKDIFPAGVAQILLLNSKSQVLNQRNFFVNFEDQLKIELAASKSTYGIRDSVRIKVKVSDYLKQPVIGSFSVAITADAQVEKDSINNQHILSYLLLSSDLKGEIENPGYYFHQPNAQTYSDLDALMLTQGWVSYHWDSDKKPAFKIEKDYTISGRVTNLVNKPSVATKVTLFGRNKQLLLIDTVTNKNGEFTFDRLPLLDSASFVIQALNQKGKRGTLGIEVNEFVRPPIVLPSKNKDEAFEEPLDSVATTFIATKNKAYQAALKSGIALREVKITAKRTIRGSKNLNGPGEASQILTETQLDAVAKKTLYQVLVEKIKGFREGYRRKSVARDFFINFDLARFVIDGVELDFFFLGANGTSDDYYQFVKGNLDYFTAEDIRGIETMEHGYSVRYRNEFIAYNDPNTYAFIEITTKTGSGPLLRKAANMYLIKPFDYGTNATFYHPMYNSTNKTDPKPDYRSTLYWNPNFIPDEKGEGSLFFCTGDLPGTYTVWIEGTDTKGGLGMKTMTLKIN